MFAHVGEAPWTIYGMNWSYRPEKRFRLTAGSFIEDYNNQVHILELNEELGRFEITGSFLHPYPTTKLMFVPDLNGTREDLLASSGDYLRIWKIGAPAAPANNNNNSITSSNGTTNKSTSDVTMISLLNNNKNSEFCAPLTSFDWCESDPAVLGTCSIDTTCTIWNIETGQAQTQIIAHDKEVYDIVFAPQQNVFASASADGSVRMFDLRQLEHSTIIYESLELVPLLRVGWNKHDSNYLATFALDSSDVVILDIRRPSSPVCELNGHHAPLNSIAWAPHSSAHIVTGGDDSQALIWDLSTMPNPITEPILAYTAKAEINQLQWGVAQPEWVAIAFDRKLQILRV